MYDHIGLRVADLDAATRFYTAVLAPLGYVLCSSGDGYAGFGPKGEPALWLHLNKGRKADGAHIAFRAGDHDAVKAFHSEGLKSGGRDNGGAGPRKDYSPTYYAAFLIDPAATMSRRSVAEHPPRHCERSEAIQTASAEPFLDCFAARAMTGL